MTGTLAYIHAHWFYFLLWGMLLPAFTHYQVGRIVKALRG